MKQIHKKHKSHIPQIDGLLTSTQFLEKFFYCENSELDKLIKNGLPVVKIGRYRYFDKEKCHAWFRGTASTDEKLNSTPLYYKKGENTR